jgi:hypothetical protein
MSIYKGNQKILQDATNLPIVQTVDENSTEEQVASAKAVYDQIKNVKITEYTHIADLELSDSDFDPADFNANIIKIKDNMSVTSRMVATTANYPNFGDSILKKLLADTGYDLTNTANANTYVSFTYDKGGRIYGPTMFGFIIDGTLVIGKRFECLIDTTSGGSLRIGRFVATYNSDKDICYTTVKDEENVNVTSSLNTAIASVNSIAYTVKNGICYVRVNNLKPLATCNEIMILPNGTLPEASTSLCYANISTWGETTTSTILLQPNTNGSLDLWCNSNALNKAHYGMFSYPVAES